MKRYSFALAAFLFLAACGGGSPEVVDENAENPTGVTETGSDVNSAFGALTGIMNAGKNMAKWQEEIENMKPTDPVSFNTLIAALPDVPSGWTADDPFGETSSMGNFKISTARRSYTQDGGDASVEIEISDWAYNQAVYAPFLLASQFSQESTEGYQKGITVGEDPGFEEYDYDSKSGTRQVIVDKRYHTQIQINDLPAEAMQKWWERVKVSELP